MYLNVNVWLFCVYLLILGYYFWPQFDKIYLIVKMQNEPLKRMWFLRMNTQVSKQGHNWKIVNERKAVFGWTWWYGIFEIFEVNKICHTFIKMYVFLVGYFHQIPLLLTFNNLFYSEIPGTHLIKVTIILEIV